MAEELSDELDHSERYKKLVALVSQEVLSPEDTLQIKTLLQNTSPLMKVRPTSSKYYEVVIEAACKGHLEILSVLLQDPRVNPAAGNNKLFRIAGMFNPLVTRMLLDDPRIDPAANNNELIASCLERDCSVEVLQILLQDARMNPAASGEYFSRSNKLFRDAVGDGGEGRNPEIISLLLNDRRIDPSFVDTYKFGDEILSFLRNDLRMAVLDAACNGDVETLHRLFAIPQVIPLGISIDALLSCRGTEAETCILSYLHDQKADIPHNVLRSEARKLLRKVFDVSRKLGLPKHSSLTRSLLINTIHVANSHGWRETNQQLSPSIDQVTDSIKDYAYSVLAPKVLYEIYKLGSTHPLYHAVLAGGLQTYLGQFILEKTIEMLFQDKNILDIGVFSVHWHAALQQTVFKKCRNYGAAEWPSLFKTREDNELNVQHKEIPIPSEVIEAEGWKFVVRTSHSELLHEGQSLKHCVGGYAQECLYKNTHILSLVDHEGAPVSTVELLADSTNCRIEEKQHHGYQNSSPSEQSRMALTWLKGAIENGMISIDYAFLQDEQDDRFNGLRAPNFKIIATSFLGFDPTDLKMCQKVAKIYRTHTPQVFKDALHELITLTSILLPSAQGMVSLQLKKIDLKKEARAAKWEGQKRLHLWQTAPEANVTGEENQGAPKQGYSSKFRK